MSGNFVLFLQEEKEVQLHSCKHLITFRLHIMTSCSDTSAVAMKCGEHLQILILPAYSLFTPHIPQSIEKQLYINVKRITVVDITVSYLWVISLFLHTPHLPATCSWVGFAALADWYSFQQDQSWSLSADHHFLLISLPLPAPPVQWYLEEEVHLK